jgi:hypothetical protein
VVRRERDGEQPASAPDANPRRTLTLGDGAIVQLQVPEPDLPDLELNTRYVRP